MATVGERQALLPQIRSQQQMQVRTGPYGQRLSQRAKAEVACEVPVYVPATGPAC